MDPVDVSANLRIKYQKKREKAMKGSFYGKNVWIGLHTLIQESKVLKKIETIALAVLGTYFLALTTYYSFDGCWHMIKWCIDQKIDGQPLPSDIGHGGEWLQQPFQNFLVVYLLFITTWGNEGHLSRVKKTYAKQIKKIIKCERREDISDIYSNFEEDCKALVIRGYRSTNLFEIKREAIQFFSQVDTSRKLCSSLDLDRKLQNDYNKLHKKIQKLDNWNPCNLAKNMKTGIIQLGKRGIGQAVEKFVCFSLFQIVNLVSTAFLIFGLSIVIDEVFISERSRESSGHLSEWSINIMTNFFLIYYISYLFLIKREAMFVRIRRVMKHHLEGMEECEGLNRGRLTEVMNGYLDYYAEKCHFPRLPSSYRLS